MSILLIRPPRSLTDKNIWKNVASCTPPFGLTLLAAILEKENINCDILDCEAEHSDMSDILNSIKNKKYEYIGISSVTVTINISMKIANEIKTIFPNIKIIMGGVHPTIFYKELINEKFIDFIIRNEAEEALVQLLNEIPHEKINNLSYKSEGIAYHNEDRSTLYNLNTQPILAYHKLPMDKYFPPLGGYKRKPALGMITSRGCPGKCTFCFSGMFGEKMRYMPAENMVQEIIYLQKKYGIKELNFYDDTFTVNKKNVTNFCNMIIDKKIDITWTCFARVDTINLELLKLMKKAGCHQILFGIESADEEILKNINKKANLEKGTEAIKISKKAGIHVRASFMLGNPGETKETINKTIEYAKKINPDIVMFNITTPFPGTKMFDWAKENGFLLTENWDDYDLSKPVMKLPTLSVDDLNKYYKIAYRKYYMRIGYLVYKIFSIRSLEDIKMNINALRAILKI